MRAGGILLPIFSIPSKYGIGGFSREAYQFVDDLCEAQQKYWQILPLGPTGYGDSPYQSFSSFAGNPYFIDIDSLLEEGLLTKAECLEYEELVKEKNFETIDYKFLYETRYPLLKKAFLRFNLNDTEFRQFIEDEKVWLDGYCRFMTIKKSLNDISLSEWDIELRKNDEHSVSEILENLKEEIQFHQFMQYKLMQQWNKLHGYANSKGIYIIGDMPIYVAYDSADSWNWPELFQFDDNLLPTEVAGCPPDAFSMTGQLWGNPLYDWEYHKKSNYEWWKMRLSHSFKLFDVVRIDHFRGFDEYYAIPYGSPTAEHGCWKPGPGMDLFKNLSQNDKPMEIIAEDLGFLTDSVVQLLKDSGYPGMKVLQFAFDSREESNYLPHTYQRNCVVYTGTHDNDTIVGWLNSASNDDIEYACEYMGCDPSDSNLYWRLIQLALQSVADYAIIPIQDYLGQGSEARINIPSTLGENWCYQLDSSLITHELLQRIARMMKLYGRTRKQD